MRHWNTEDQGMATLETTLMVVILVPLLFAILEFGWLTQRWLAQDGVALQAARYAGGQLRKVYFWPNELAGHVERTYHPGE